MRGSPRPQAGGGLPRHVIRGGFGSDLAVSVDYLNATFTSGSPADYVSELASAVGATFCEDRGRGLHGYAHSVDVGGFGFVAYGGGAQRGTVFVQCTGAGCQRIARFREFSEWCSAREGRITRLDIAADDHRGLRLSVGNALDAWRAGLFDNQGTRCKGQLVDDLGSGRGRTFYAGARLSGKLCRVYDKGKQLGDTSSPWVRAEVEFLAKQRVIPWDAVANPIPYIAGSYPYFTQFSMEASKLRVFKESKLLTVAALTEWARVACGRTVNLLLHRAGGDIGEVIAAVRREGFPKRFERFAGVVPDAGSD